VGARHLRRHQVHLGAQDPHPRWRRQVLHGRPPLRRAPRALRCLPRGALRRGARLFSLAGLPRLPALRRLSLELSVAGRASSRSRAFPASRRSGASPSPPSVAGAAHTLPGSAPPAARPLPATLPGAAPPSRRHSLPPPSVCCPSLRRPPSTSPCHGDLGEGATAPSRRWRLRAAASSLPPRPLPWLRASPRPWAPAHPSLPLSEPSPFLPAARLLFLPPPACQRPFPGHRRALLVLPSAFLRAAAPACSALPGVRAPPRCTRPHPAPFPTFAPHTPRPAAFLRALRTAAPMRSAPRPSCAACARHRPHQCQPPLPRHGYPALLSPVSASLPVHPLVIALATS
jgi:hypothetical protein